MLAMTVEDGVRRMYLHHHSLYASHPCCHREAQPWRPSGLGSRSTKDAGLLRCARNDGGATHNDGEVAAATTAKAISHL